MSSLAGTRGAGAAGRLFCGPRPYPCLACLVHTDSRTGFLEQIKKGMASLFIAVWSRRTSLSALCRWHCRRRPLPSLSLPLNQPIHHALALSSCVCASSHFSDGSVPSCSVPLAWSQRSPVVTRLQFSSVEMQFMSSHVSGAVCSTSEPQQALLA
jgi:hypothetical protein